MEIAKIKVTDVRAETVSALDIPCGIVGATVSFEFGPEWADLTKNVVFIGAKDVAFMNVENTVHLPAEVVAVPNINVKVGVVGVDADNKIVIPTLWADLGTVKHGTPVETGYEPALPVWAQLLGMIGNLRELDTEAKNNLVAAINEIFSTGGGSGYVLPIAGENLGGVKNGGNVVINEDGTMTAPEAGQNPAGGGLSAAASALLIGILKNAVYTADQSANITALEVELAMGGGSGSGGSGGGEVSAYTVVSTLDNATIDNNASAVAAGASYTATITPADGYELDAVTVLMGGVDVTADVYADGVITIESVTGNVIIKVTTVEASDVLYKLAAPVTFTGTEEPIDTHTKINAEDIDYTFCVKITCDKAADDYNGFSLVADNYPNGLAINHRSYYSKMIAAYFMNKNMSPNDDWRLNGAGQNILVVTHIAGSGEYIQKLAYPTKEGRESYSPSAITVTGATFQAINETIRFGYVGFVGTFDDLIIYNRVLTEDEINTYLGVA